MFGIPLTAAALKVCVITICALVPALALSVAFNVKQFGDAAEKRGADDTAKVLGTEISRLEAIAESAKRAASIADEAKTDQAELLLELGAIADRGRERVTIYRDVIKTLPPAACPPGRERVDATNRILQ